MWPGQGVDGVFLYLMLDFTVNLKLLLTTKSVFLKIATYTLGIGRVLKEAYFPPRNSVSLLLFSKQGAGSGGARPFTAFRLHWAKDNKCSYKFP